MRPTQFLRLEAAAVLAAALAAYGWLDGPVWLFVVLILTPDLSMLAYLAGPRLGSLGYNVAHLYAWPVLLGGVGIWFDAVLATQVAAVWAAHIGMDRLAGYGLKHETGFKDTHLSAAPVPDVESAMADPSTAP